MTPRRAHARAVPSRRGFTLVELVVSLALGTMLMAALGSAVVLASRALPDRSSDVLSTMDAARALAAVAEELGTATELTRREAAAVTAVLPADATATTGAAPRVVSYAWSSDGGSLRRTSSAGGAGDVLADVRRFAVEVQSAPVAKTWSVAGSTAPEQLHAAYTTYSSIEFRSVDENKLSAQLVTPAWNSDWATWSVTKVRLRLLRQGSQNLRVQVRLAASSGRPTSTVLAEAELTPWQLPAVLADWVDIPISVTGIAYGQKVCVVLRGDSSSGHAAAVEIVNSGAKGLSTSGNGGSSWVWAEDGVNDSSMRYEVFGTYTLKPAVVTLTRPQATAVRLGVQAGGARAMQWATAPLLNRPVLVDALWEADFASVPTALDLQSDGVADWRMADGTAFLASRLSAGVWRVHGSLYTRPDASFTGVTTASLRLRDTSDDGYCGGVKLRLDRSGSTYAYVEACIELIGGTQKLMVTSVDEGFNTVVWASVDVPAGQFAQLDLLADDATNRVLVLVDGAAVGCFEYVRVSGSGPAVVELMRAGGSGVEIDHARVARGGVVIVEGPATLPNTTGSTSGGGLVGGVLDLLF